MKTIQNKFTVTTNDDGTYTVEINNVILLENKQELANYLNSVTDDPEEYI